MEEAITKFNHLGVQVTENKMYDSFHSFIGYSYSQQAKLNIDQVKAHRDKISKS